MSLPGYDTWKLASPPYLDGYPEELCDRCERNDLGETAVRVKERGYVLYLCEECATPVEHCEQCHLYRCECP